MVLSIEPTNKGFSYNCPQKMLIVQWSQKMSSLVQLYLRENRQEQTWVHGSYQKEIHI